MSLPRSNALKMTILASVSLLASGCIIGILDVDDDGSQAKVEVFDHQFYTLELEDQSLLRVVSVNGTVRVRGASGADRVTVNVTRRVQARSHSQAEDHLHFLQIHLSRSPQAIFVETSQPSSEGGITYVVDYDITVPPDLEVEVIQANGEVRIEDIGTGAVGVGSATFECRSGSRQL